MKKIIILSIIVLLAGMAGFTQETKETGETQEKQETQAVQVEQKTMDEPPAQKTETETEAMPKVDDLQLCRVYFPKNFIHSGKNYKRGIYQLALSEKDGTPWFKVFDKKKEFLFEEMSVVKPNERKNKRFKYRLRKEMLRGYEYFRVKVIKPEKEIIGYFFVQEEKGEPTSEEKTDTEEPAKKKDGARITH